jgi:hypothetical protein
MRSMHHPVHQEAMQMTRLTVTLDEAGEAEISSVQESLDTLKASVYRALDADPTAGTGVFLQLADSLEALGKDPSAASVMRHALDFFVGSIRRADQIAELEVGYGALAQVADRAGVLSAMRDRVPDRFQGD